MTKKLLAGQKPRSQADASRPATGTSRGNSQSCPSVDLVKSKCMQQTAKTLKVAQEIIASRY